MALLLRATRKSVFRFMWIAGTVQVLSHRLGRYHSEPIGDSLSCEFAKQQQIGDNALASVVESCETFEQLEHEKFEIFCPFNRTPSWVCRAFDSRGYEL